MKWRAWKCCWMTGNLKTASWKLRQRRMRKNYRTWMSETISSRTGWIISSSITGVGVPERLTSPWPRPGGGSWQQCCGWESLLPVAPPHPTWCSWKKTPTRSDSTRAAAWSSTHPPWQAWGTQTHYYAVLQQKRERRHFSSQEVLCPTWEQRYYFNSSLYNSTFRQLAPMFMTSLWQVLPKHMLSPHKWPQFSWARLTRNPLSNEHVTPRTSHPIHRTTQNWRFACLGQLVRG